MSWCAVPCCALLGGNPRFRRALQLWQGCWKDAACGLTLQPQEPLRKAAAAQLLLSWLLLLLQVGLWLPDDCHGQPHHHC